MCKRDELIKRLYTLFEGHEKLNANIKTYNEIADIADEIYGKCCCSETVNDNKCEVIQSLPDEINVVTITGIEEEN